MKEELKELLREYARETHTYDFGSDSIRSYAHLYRKTYSAILSGRHCSDGGITLADIPECVDKVMPCIEAIARRILAPSDFVDLQELSAEDGTCVHYIAQSIRKRLICDMTLSFYKPK